MLLLSKAFYVCHCLTCFYPPKFFSYLFQHSPRNWQFDARHLRQLKLEVYCQLQFVVIVYLLLNSFQFFLEPFLFIFLQSICSSLILKSPLSRFARQIPLNHQDFHSFLLLRAYQGLS